LARQVVAVDVGRVVAQADPVAPATIVKVIEDGASAARAEHRRNLTADIGRQAASLHR
jgi:hypothetical protein